MIDFLLGTRERRATTETNLALKDIWKELTGGRKTSAGQTVSEDSALGITAYFCGTMIIVDAFKSLPTHLYREMMPRGKEKVSGHPAAKLLRERPNTEMSPSRFASLVPMWSGPWGNFYAEIERTKSGRPLNLWPIHPSRVRKYRKPDRSVWFEVHNEKGGAVNIPDGDILHVMRHTLDGFCGIGNVGLHRESLGMSVAADQYGARFFGGNAMPGVLVTAKDALEKPELDEFRRQWVEAYGGENSGGVGFVGGSEDIKIERLTVPNEDAQFLETRKYQVNEIARILVISPFRLKELDRATYNSSSVEESYFVRETMMPYCLDFEEECDRKLLTEAERNSGMFFKVNTSALLRGDVKTQSDVLLNYKRGGVLSADDVRDEIDRNPLPDGQGDIYTVEANLTPAAEIVAKTEAIDSGDMLPDGTMVNKSPDPAPAPPDPPPNRSAIDAAFAPVVASAAARLARVESDKVGRMAKKPDEYAAWRTSFVGEHRDRVTEELTPVVIAYRAAAGLKPDASAATGIVDEYLIRLMNVLKTADSDAVLNRDAGWIMAKLQEAT